MNQHVMISLCDGILNRFDPLGARCIMGVIEKAGGSFVRLLQDRLLSREKIIQEIVDLNPCAVWVSIQPGTLRVLKFIKHLSKLYDGSIIIGNVGSYRLLVDELKLLRSNIVVVVGQGEDTTLGLYAILKRHKILNETDFDHISNLRYFSFKDSKLVETKFMPSDLAKKTIPSQLNLSEAIKRDDIITTRSSSGCNFSCVFCTVKEINNKQCWVAHSPKVLKEHLTRIVKNGMEEGMVRLVDDDLAGNIENVMMVADTFNEINKEFHTNIKFGFATRASHFSNVKDTTEQADKRIEIWKYAVDFGLKTIFLGLESGSTTQLKRLGKSITAECNFKAANIAQSLNIDLEIGFIPIDPFMKDETWRQEMRDNIKLACHVNVAKTSPTWLAPLRVYEGSPISIWLRKQYLLGEKISGTDEYYFEYISHEVARFIEILGPSFCEGKHNGLYDLKREIKNVQRYPFGLSQKIETNCNEIIRAEIEFVKKLLETNLQDLSIANIQKEYIKVLETNIKELIEKIMNFGKKKFTKKVLHCCYCAMQMLWLWKAHIKVIHSKADSNPYLRYTKANKLYSNDHLLTIFQVNSDLESNLYESKARVNSLKTKEKTYSKYGVAAFILDDMGRVLLLLRNKEPSAGCWTIPGGKLDSGENFYTALEREVKEEIGLLVEILSLLTITEPFDSSTGEQWFSPVFLVAIKDDKLPRNLEPNKHAQLKWFPLSQVPKNMNTTTSLAVQAYLRACLKSTD